MPGLVDCASGKVQEVAHAGEALWWYFFDCGWSEYDVFPEHAFPVLQVLELLVAAGRVCKW